LPGRKKKKKNGWHLTRVGFFNYRFEKGEPSDMVYKFDFKVLRKAEMNDYILTFEDAGWEHIGNFGSWFYFRTTADGDHSLELYNDNRSMIEKYKRLLLVLGVICFSICQTFICVLLIWQRTAYSETQSYSIYIYHFSLF